MTLHAAREWSESFHLSEFRCVFRRLTKCMGLPQARPEPQCNHGEHNEYSHSNAGLFVCHDAGDDNLGAGRRFRKFDFSRESF